MIRRPRRSGRSLVLALIVVLGLDDGRLRVQPVDAGAVDRGGRHAIASPTPTASTSPSPTVVPPTPTPTPAGELVAADLHRRPRGPRARPSAAAGRDDRRQPGGPPAIGLQRRVDRLPVPRRRLRDPLHAGLPGGRHRGNVGPVRSARFFLVEWAQEYKSALAHYGGDRRTRTYIRYHPKQFTDVDGIHQRQCGLPPHQDPQGAAQRLCVDRVAPSRRAQARRIQDDGLVAPSPAVP